ncbi:hypothetical protein Tco_0916598, partial [Tanacetum coccineum]
MPRKNFNELSEMLYQALKEMLPSMVNKEVNKIAKTTVPVYVVEGLLLERQKHKDDVVAMIVEAIQKERQTLRAEVISQVNDVVANHIPSQVDSFLRNYMSNNILHVHPTQTAQATAQEQQYQLYLTMKNDEQLQQQALRIWLSLKIKFEGITVATACHLSAIRSRDYDNYQDDDARLEGENSAKRQKTSEYGTYTVGESSSDLVKLWIMIKIRQAQKFGEIDEAKLQKAVNEMLRQRCNSREEHHIQEEDTA